MVSPASNPPWKGQSEPMFGEPENPGRGYYNSRTNDSSFDVSDFRQSGRPFMPNFPIRNHKSSSPFKEVPKEQNIRSDLYSEKPMCEKPPRGDSKEKHVGLNDCEDDVIESPQRSIFLTKYFPDQSTVHWKKIMAGMNVDMTTELQLEDSLDSKDRPGSCVSPALAHDLILHNCHTTTTTTTTTHHNNNNAHIPSPQNHTVDSTTVSSGNHYSTKDVNGCGGDVARGQRNAVSPDSPWDDCNNGGSTNISTNGFVPRGTPSLYMAYGVPGSRKREHEAAQEATSTTTDGYSSTPAPSWDRLGQQPPALSLDQEVTATLECYASMDCPSGKTEPLPSPTHGDSPHSTQVQLQPGPGVGGKAGQPDSGLCQVCQDIAAGFYCGAFVCEACKKFFIRASKQEKQKFVCLRDSMCKITKESRVQCQYCRYQKCLKLNMRYPGEGKRSVNSIHVSGIPCRVCGSPSSGFHFGALTCEGCKGFFRRMVKEREPGMYKCSSGGRCEISVHTRNMCKACRYQKCLHNGMSVEGSRIGRQPNAVKHAISLEVKKQRKEQPLNSDLLIPNQDHHHYQQLKPHEHQHEHQQHQYQNHQQPNLSSSMVIMTTPGVSGDGFSSAGTTKTLGPSELGSEGEGGSFRQISVIGSGVVASSSSSLSSSSPSSLSGVGGSFGCGVEVKEEPESPYAMLNDVVLTQVHPAVIVKQEPETDDYEEFFTALTAADKELKNMCAVQRAKQNTIDETEFESYPIMWRKQMRHFDFHAQCSIRFSKKLPGFKDIPLDDQVMLVQRSVYPVVVLNHSRTYELDTGFYNFFNFTKPEELRVLSMCPSYVMLQSHFKHMGTMAQTMAMTDMEFTLMSSLLVCEPECQGLLEKRLVQQLQTRLLSFMQSYEIKTHPHKPMRFGEMLLRISELKLAAEQHIQTIHSFVTQHSELEIPHLFKEMFF